MPRDVQSNADAPTRAGVLRVLRDAGEPLRVEEVAAAVGLKVSGTRWQLDRLVETGAVRRSFVKAGSRGRPAALYSAAPAADVDDVEPYRMLAELLAAQLDAVTTGDGDSHAPARQAGADWADAENYIATGNQADSPAVDDIREALTKLLDDTGFRPRPSEDPTEIELGRCPFFDVASAHPRIVCGIHADLLLGALQRLGAPAGAVNLLPVLAADQPCLVRMKDPDSG